jgi:hypothetical protein
MDEDRLDVPTVANEVVKMATEFRELQEIKREARQNMGRLLYPAYGIALVVGVVGYLAGKFPVIAMALAGVIIVIAFGFAAIGARREHLAHEAALRAEIEAGADPYERTP